MADINKQSLEMTDIEINRAIRGSSLQEFGVISSKFLSQSIGVLNPRKPICILQDLLLKEVIDLLQKNSIGSVLVVDSAGVLVGIFTERDCLLKVSGDKVDLNTTKISEVMTPNPQSQMLDSTIAFALNLMSLGGFRHIPIVDQDNMPVGVISVKDIVDHLVHSFNADLLSIEEEE